MEKATKSLPPGLHPSQPWGIGALRDGSKDNSDVAVRLGVAGNASRTLASILHVGTPRLRGG